VYCCGRASDKKYFDCYWEEQSLYYVTKSGVYVLDPGSVRAHKVRGKGGLLGKVPFHGTYMTMDEILEQMGPVGTGRIRLRNLPRDFVAGLFSGERRTTNPMSFEVDTSVPTVAWLDTAFRRAEKKLCRN